MSHHALLLCCCHVLQAAEAERSAKQAADEARLAQKFDKVRVNAYISNKDKKFLKMRDGRA